MMDVQKSKHSSPMAGSVYRDCDGIFINVKVIPYV